MRRCLALFAIPLAACADQAPPSMAVVRDSAGVRIVENTTPQWQPGDEWRLSEEPVVDIGGGDTKEDQLFRVRGAVRLSDGKIVVANRGTNELRFYSVRGEHIASVGGQGGGPGEYSVKGKIRRMPRYQNTTLARRNATRRANPNVGANES